MLIYILKWSIASLVMPLLVLIAGRFINQFVILVFWPGSISLMSLGAEDKPFSTVICTWALGISLNILTYSIIGSVAYFFIKSNTQT